MSKIDKLNAELDALTGEIEAISRKYEGKRFGDSDEGRAAAKRRDECADQALAIQGEIEAELKAGRAIEGARRYDRVSAPLPSDDTGPAANDVVGYVSLGEAVLASKSFQTYAERGMPRGAAAEVDVGALRMVGDTPMVPVTAAWVKEFRQLQAKASVPTLGAGVLTVDRLPVLPQVTRDRRLTIRDVLATGTTTSGSVSYVRHEGDTGAAAGQVHGQPKADVSTEYSLQTAPVVTIAAWMPVQDQQLEDWPLLASLINGRLTYAVQLEEEKQLIWGSGSPDLVGLLDPSVAVPDIRTNGRALSGQNGDTLIDTLRRGLTDVIVAGYQPSAAVVHPYDWEEIVLEKGTDSRYVWAVVTDGNGSRLWGTRVVESVAMDDGTGNRNVLIGDFALGAQLLDRAGLAVRVGLVNDQFIRNMRTILAEERVAFPIYAPKAFATAVTDSGS